MARNFLGNLKGPQGPKGDTGPKGDKGDTGEFKDTAIGMINKLDVSQPQLLESGDTWEFDKKTGIVNYNFVKGHFIAFDVELEPRVHTFRIEDFTDNANYDGDFRFQVRDSNREYIHLTNVPKKGYYTFDLTSYEGVEKYKIHFYREAGQGFFEKPMLVEGDYSVLWNDSNLITNYSEYRMFESKIPPNVETQLRPYPQSGDILGNVDSDLVLTTGVWLINWNFYINNQNGDVRLRLYKDGELIADKLSSDGYENLSRLISVKSGSSQLRFTVQNMGDNELTMSTAIRNNMQLKKL